MTQQTRPNTTQTGTGEVDVPEDVLALLARADLVFLATKYSGHDARCFSSDPPRLGNNHRGGPPGFLRTFWDGETKQRCVVLPDWSGNRLMMSFGNMTKDPVAGLTIPVWSHDPQQGSGVVHLTCRAHVLAGSEAARLIRGVHGAVKLWVEAWSWVRHGLPVVSPSGPEAQDVGWSPYNPPVRLLHGEEKAVGIGDDGQQAPTAYLVDATVYSAHIGTFVFAVSEADRIFRHYRPGMHIVMDCQELLDTRVRLYSHMAAFRGGEKDLNDDGTRSWTVTYAERVCASTWRFALTLRRKQRGGVTPSLFRMGQQIRAEKEANDDSSAQRRAPCKVLGIGGSTVLPPFPTNPQDAHALVYLVAGIGVTPFLAHLAHVAADVQTPTSILAVVAVRRGEAPVMQRLLYDVLARHATEREGQPSLALRVYFLVSTRPTEATDETCEAHSVHPLSWHAFPAWMHVDAKVVEGRRLADSSFCAEEADPTSFVLAPSDRPTLHAATSIVLCASDAFSTLR